jgi:hypothetical protein
VRAPNGVATPHAHAPGVVVAVAIIVKLRFSIVYNCRQFNNHSGIIVAHIAPLPYYEGASIMNQADATRAELFGLLEHLERLANERLGITNEPEPTPEPTPAPTGKTAKRMAEFDAMSDEKQIAKLLELFA